MNQVKDELTVIYKEKKVAVSNFHIVLNETLNFENSLDLNEEENVNIFLRIKASSCTSSCNEKICYTIKLVTHRFVDFKTLKIVLIKKNSHSLYFDLENSVSFKTIYVGNLNVPSSDDPNSEFENSYEFEVDEILFSYSFKSTHSKEIPNFIKTALDIGEYCDLTITVFNKVFKVHKLIVCNKIKAFKAMINIDMVEKQTNNIDLKDTVKPSAFEEIIKFIYKGKCNLSNDVHEIFRFAHQYEINDLEKNCRKYMLENISKLDKIETVKLINIENYNLNNLKNVFENYINENEVAIVKDKKYIKYLVDNMTVENVHFIYRLANEYQLDVLNKINEFIMLNLQKVVDNKEFENFVKNSGLGFDMLRTLANSGRVTYKN